VLCPEGALPGGEGRLRAGKVARLQGLCDGLEILIAIGSLKDPAVLVRAILAERVEGGDVLLRRLKIAGLQVLLQLNEVRFSLLAVIVQLLVDGSSVIGCGQARHAAEGDNRCRSEL
jgi:hypothetical protein